MLTVALCVLHHAVLLPVLGLISLPKHISRMPWPHRRHRVTGSSHATPSNHTTRLNTCPAAGTARLCAVKLTQTARTWYILLSTSLSMVSIILVYVWAVLCSWLHNPSVSSSFFFCFFARKTENKNFLCEKQKRKNEKKERVKHSTAASTTTTLHPPSTTHPTSLHFTPLYFPYSYSSISYHTSRKSWYTDAFLTAFASVSSVFWFPPFLCYKTDFPIVCTDLCWYDKNIQYCTFINISRNTFIIIRRFDK